MCLNPVNILLWTSISIFVNGRIRAILVRKPQNSTAVNEGTVRFNCSTDSPLNRIQWLYEYRGATRPFTIFNGSTVQVGYSERFLVETNGIPGRYDLIFKEIQTEDSGVYYCVEILQYKSKGQESAAHLIVYAVFKNLTVEPQNTSAAIGSEARLNCTSSCNRSVSWQHQPVGKRRESVFLGVEGMLMNGYRSGGRHSIDRDEATGRYDLVINGINRDDAGTYICIDEAGSGKETEAQLFVLEEQPKCSGNFSEDGILVENSCGLEQDVIIISCRIAYHGIGSPWMKWANATDDSPIQNSTCIDIGKFKVCSVVVVASVFTNWSEYVCKVSEKNTCRTGNVTRNVIYVSTSSSNSPDDNSCHIKSSQPCHYSLRKKHSSNTSRPMEPVQYECSAVCNIRGTECIIVRPVPVEDHSARVLNEHSDGKMVIVVVVVGCLLCLTLLGIIVIVRRKRTKNELNNSIKTRSTQDLPKFGKYHLETKSASKITGLTILDKNLYIIFAYSSTVRVYKNETPYTFLFEFEVANMNPHDITSCPGENALFVSGNGSEGSSDDSNGGYRLWEIRGPFRKNRPHKIISHRGFENVTSPGTLSVTPSDRILIMENITTPGIDLNNFCRAYFARNDEICEPVEPSSFASSPVIHMFAMPQEDDCEGKHLEIGCNDRRGNASGNGAHENESAASNEHEPSDKWYIANRKDKKICSLDVAKKKIIVHEFDHEKIKHVGEISLKDIDRKIEQIEKKSFPFIDIIPRLCCNDEAKIYLVVTSDNYIYEFPYADNYGGMEPREVGETDELLHSICIDVSGSDDPAIGSPS